MAGLLCYCRPGFEPELAAELSERAAHAGHPGYARTERNSAFVTFICDEATALSRALPWRELIYARQKLQLVAELREDFTILIVTHSMQQAARCSDQTVFMYLGDVIEFGSTAQIFTNPKVKQTQEYVTGRFG